MSQQGRVAHMAHRLDSPSAEANPMGVGAPSPGTRLIGVGIVLVALYAGLKGRRFGRVDYAALARDFLATAARQYQFWRATDLLYAIPVLLTLLVGGALTVWGIAQK